MLPASDLSTSDRALVAALAAWGGVEALPLLRRFGTQRAKELAGALVPEPPPDPLGWLRSTHDAQRRPDPSRVHPSWYVRALEDESPAVRRAVVASTPEPARSALIRGLGLGPDDLTPDRPADPEAVAIALGLWTERLVGDLPRPDDPPALAALTGFGAVGRYRLFHLCGLAKRSIIPGTSIEDGPPLRAARSTWFRDRVAGPIDPRLVQIAANEWRASESFGRHRLAGYGLTTVGRLLGRADPFRVRWALQHVPYPIAKRLRVAASRPEASTREVLRLEERLLDAVFERLRAEGRTP